MKILALDCATRTGWCIVADGQIAESGMQDFSKGRGESNGMMFLRFRKWLSEMVKNEMPGVVAYERAHFRGGAATEICVGLQTRAQEIAAEWHSEVLAVPTQTLKKWATGSGRAEKPAMIARAAEWLGRQPVDDNEADAVCLAMYAWDIVGCSVARPELA